MTRNEIIKKLESLKELFAWENIENLTDYAREKAYYDIDNAIEHLKENEEREVF